MPKRKISKPSLPAVEVPRPPEAEEMSEIISEAPLPGGVVEEEPVGVPEIEREPEGASFEFREFQPHSAISYDSDLFGESAAESSSVEDGDDLHAVWAAREAEHRRKVARLSFLVGAAMVGIVAIWFLTLSDGIRSAAPSSGVGAAIKQQFLSELAGYQKQFESLTAAAKNGVVNSPTTVPTGASVATPSTFLESLKVRAAAAATATVEKSR